MEEQDEYFYVQTQNYTRIVQSDGVRTTVCENRFEILAMPHSEVWEQQAVQALREWVRWRKENGLQDAGDLPK